MGDSESRGKVRDLGLQLRQRERRRRRRLLLLSGGSGTVLGGRGGRGGGCGLLGRGVVRLEGLPVLGLEGLPGADPELSLSVSLSLSLSLSLSHSLTHSLSLSLSLPPFLPSSLSLPLPLLVIRLEHLPGDVPDHARVHTPDGIAPRCLLAIPPDPPGKLQVGTGCARREQGTHQRGCPIIRGGRIGGWGGGVSTRSPTMPSGRARCTRRGPGATGWRGDTAPSSLLVSSPSPKPGSSNSRNIFWRAQAS